MTEKHSDLRSEAEAMLNASFSNVNADYVQKMWEHILEFIEKNDYVTLDDFLKVLELLQQEDAYTYKEPENEILDTTSDSLEEEMAFDELSEEHIPEEVKADKTSLEELIDAIKAQNDGIMVSPDVINDCDNHLQVDLVEVILNDVNDIVHEGRSQYLNDCLGGVSTQDPHYLDKMIAVAPHSVVKGTLKALYQHIGGMHQNLIYGSEMYPDEAGFAGAIKDVLADKTMIRGSEPWQVHYGPKGPNNPY